MPVASGVPNWDVWFSVPGVFVGLNEVDPRACLGITKGLLRTCEGQICFYDFKELFGWSVSAK